MKSVNYTRHSEVEDAAKDLVQELQAFLTPGEPRKPMTQGCRQALKAKISERYIDEMMYFLYRGFYNDARSDIDALEEVIKQFDQAVH